MKSEILCHRCWCAAILVIFIVGCTPALDTDTMSYREQVPFDSSALAPTEGKLKFPIYSPPPRVLFRVRVDSGGRISIPSIPYQPPILYEFPLNHGRHFLPHEVE